MRRLLAAALLSLLLPFSAQAQESDDLGDVIKDVGGDYARLYVQPLVDAFGADINSGLYHSADISAGLFPLVDVYVGAEAFGAFLAPEAQTLSLDYTRTETFTYDGQDYEIPVTYTVTDAPTVFGRRQAGTITARVDTTIDGRHIEEERSFQTLPGVVHTRFAPLLVPQVKIGTSLIGTELTLRYLPQIDIADYGAFNMHGIGIRHNVSQYIPLLPVDISTQVMYQTLGIEDASENNIVSAEAWAVNVAASKSLLLLTVYGGLQIERTTVDVEYTFDPEDERLPSTTVDLGLSGKNRMRALAGASLNLGLFNVHADYSLGNINVVSAGVGVVL